MWATTERTAMQLVLIRGLPGSGKSTLAKAFHGHNHYEADMFFVNENGRYFFNPEKIKEAHSWCQLMTKAALKDGKDVVVSNTFTQHWELKPYLDIAKEANAKVAIIVAKGNFKSVHNVPNAVIASMQQRWED